MAGGMEHQLRTKHVANLQQPDVARSELPAPEPAPLALTANDAGRRRFGKAGVGTSVGVILTLTSQPGMARLMCVSPSAEQSGNTSHAHKLQVACVGRSPGFWKNHAEAWPSAGTSTDAMFSAIFTTGTYRTTLLSPYSCMEVLDPKDIKQKGVPVVDADPDNVAMHIVATLLNVRSGRISFLTENQVTGIWNSYATKGYYEPTAGVKWYGDKIVEYLKKTMS